MSLHFGAYFPIFSIYKLLNYSSLLASMLNLDFTNTKVSFCEVYIIW